MLFSDPAMSAALIMQMGGVLGSAIGGYYSASTQAYNLETQARIADINSRIAEMGAQSTLEQGKQQVANYTLQVKQLKGKQRARLAANGVDLSVGNAAELQAGTDIIKDIDKSMIQMNALRSAWGQRMQATNQTIQAIYNRASASSINPTLSAATSLLGGATNVASSWYMYNRIAGNSAPQYQYESIDALAAERGWW